MSAWIQLHLDAAGGRLRFDRFMELALYDPDHGYYTTRISTLGPRGDFSTSATLSPALARALAARFRSTRQLHLIEIGAGTGALTGGIRSTLPFLNRHRTRFHIVERSPRLRESQRALVGSRVRWHDDIREALHAAGGSAVIFSNELVDAFPPRIFRPVGTIWQELYLTGSADTLHESWQPVDELPDSTVFQHRWPESQRLEVHDSYRTWLARWLPDWKEGLFLTIDYGGTPPEIHHRRPGGSLRSYLHHQSHTGPGVYRHPGRQDLTADVNFDDLRRWSRQLRPDSHLSLSTQREFLLPHIHPSDPNRFLTDPDGAGSAFKVLVMEAGRGKPEVAS